MADIRCLAFVLNASYASANQILQLASSEGTDPDSARQFQTCFDIKYELCEIILCKAV
jgi:hypothetical protein